MNNGTNFINNDQAEDILMMQEEFKKRTDNGKDICNRCIYRNEASQYCIHAMSQNRSECMLFDEESDECESCKINFD